MSLLLHPYYVIFLITTCTYRHLIHVNMILNCFHTFQMLSFQRVLNVFNELFKKKKLLNYNPVNQ